MDGGEVVGVLSEADILVKEGGERVTHTGVLGWLFETGASELEAKLAARTVGEAMTSPALTIGPDRQVHEAAARMIEDGVNRLPVVEDGKLLGIVSRADLVRAFTRTDAEIEEEIRTEIVKRTMWIAPEAVTVSVEGGTVTLEGQVETATDAELLPVFVERVPGVVEVRSALSYRDRGSKARV
jgi:CBS domain-containing protein